MTASARRRAARWYRRAVLAAATVEIAVDAATCWALLVDPTLAPAWVAGVADAEILERDDAGRAIRVRFVAMPSAGSAVSVLGYDYDAAARRVRWRTIGDADRPIEGEAQIEDLGGGRCRLHYALVATPTATLPTWARAALADDTPERAARAFQRFAERRVAAAPPR